MDFGSLLYKAKQAIQSVVKSVGEVIDNIFNAAIKAPQTFPSDVKKGVATCGQNTSIPPSKSVGKAVTISPWHRIDSTKILTSKPGCRSPGQTLSIIKQFDVDTNDTRYRLENPIQDKNGTVIGYTTWCNIFAADYMDAMGVPLPRKKTDKNMPVSVSELGPALKADKTWTSIDIKNEDDLAKLLKHINAGKPALALRGTEHIAVILPLEGVDKLTSNTLINQLRIAEAGSGPDTHIPNYNFSNGALKEGNFSENNLQIFIHE